MECEEEEFGNLREIDLSAWRSLLAREEEDCGFRKNFSDFGRTPKCASSTVEGMGKVSYGPAATKPILTILDCDKHHKNFQTCHF